MNYKKDFNSIESENENIKFNSYSNKNSLKLQLLDRQEIKSSEKEMTSEKDYFSQTINAHKLYKIKNVLKNNNISKTNPDQDEDFNILLINIPTNRVKNNKNEDNINSNITNVNININIQQIDRHNTNEDKINCKNDSKKGDINYLKNTRNENNNYNIKENEIIPYKKITSDTVKDDPVQPTSPNKNWRKLSNIFRSLNSLIRHDTKNLDNNNDLDTDLQNYKEKINTLRNRKSTFISEDGDNNHNQREFDNIRNLTNEEREIYKISVKERIYQVIVE